MRITPKFNLKADYGHIYRVRFEESYYAERSEFRSEDVPWLMIIPCHKGWGHICVRAEDRIAWCSDRRVSKSASYFRELMAIPGAKIEQDGEDGINISFPVEHLDRIAEIVKAKRRKKFSEEHKAKLAERGRAALAKVHNKPSRKNDLEIAPS